MTQNTVAESERTRERRATPMQTRVVLAKQGPLWQRMLAFLIPLIAGNLLQSLSGTIGAVYYGQMIGMSALAAAAAFFPLFFFMQSVLYGISGAGAILVGQAYGMGDRKRVKVVAGTTLTMCTFSGLAITILCALFARNILVAIGTPSDIISTTLAYGQHMFALMPILIVFIVYTSLLRAGLFNALY
jgi:Na+-driven multidrug efflux pump